MVWPGGILKNLRKLVEEPRAVDSVVVVLSAWFLLGAYIVAYAYVHDPTEVLQATARTGSTIVTAAWSALTLYLFAGFAVGLRAGRAWNRALPDGQTGTFAAALVAASVWRHCSHRRTSSR